MKRRYIWGILIAVVLMFGGCASDISHDAEGLGASEVSMENDISEDEKTRAQEGVAEEVGINTIDSQEIVSDTKEVTGILQVHYIDVGQGDSILLQQGEHTMLIDAGDNSCGTKIQAYLQANSIRTLDYVIGTHPDADHIGGLDVVIYKFDCNHIFLPDCSKDTKTYEDVLASVKEKGYQITSPVAGDSFTLGEANVTVLSPGKNVDYGDDANNNSIAVKVTYGRNSFLFTGDCEEEAEVNMMASGYNLRADVMKAGHHGSDTSNSRAFLEAVSPKFFVISCGEENDYGHPRAEVLNNIRQLGIKIYRTDEQGTIVAVSDGKDITWNTQSSESFQAGEPKGSGQPEGISEENKEDSDSSYTFILNTNTMKIHRPECSSVGQMSEKNKQKTSSSIDELEAAGYECCKKCNPQM